MNTPDVGNVLRALQELAPSDATATLLRLAEEAGASGATAYLADLSQTVLIPVPDRGDHPGWPAGQPVHGSSAGRAFAERTTVTERRDGATLVWVPILEGSECTGVLAFASSATVDEGNLRRFEELGMLVGSVISLAARQTDLFSLLRRRRSLSLAASMQWDLLPPLRIETPEGSSTGFLEPAYDVGGDTFDHAVNGFTLDVAIMDAMGHGLDSSLTSALAVGAYRHGRRDRHDLASIHREIDTALVGRFGGEVFVTGQLARLDLRTGDLHWINAGHPGPLLVRNGAVQDTLRCRPSLPWGLGGTLVEQAVEPLRPGDVVVFYSDGVVDGRSDLGLAFGIERFVAAIEEAVASAVSADLVLRRAVHEVLSFQADRLRDDATIVWLEWDPDQESAHP